MTRHARWLALMLVLSPVAAWAALPAQGAGAATRIDVAAEVNAAVYQSAAVVNALKKELDAEIRAKMGRIAALEAKAESAGADAAAARRERAALQDELVRTVAAKDAELARQIAAFRGAVESIASTPEGAAALAQRRPGNLAAVRALLLKLADDRAAAAQRSVDIAKAKDIRAIAILGLDDRIKGEATTADVIDLFQRVTALDGLYSDWIQLALLYQDAGDLAKAETAAAKGKEVVHTDKQRLMALLQLGGIAMTKGNLVEARRNYSDGLQIAEPLAALNPHDTDWQYIISVVDNKLGMVAESQANLVEAGLRYERSLQILEPLASSDPNNETWQFSLSIDHQMLGRVAMARGDLTMAHEHYSESLQIAKRLLASRPSDGQLRNIVGDANRLMGDLAVKQGDLREAGNYYSESLTIAEDLAARDPVNIDWQRDLWVMHKKLAEVAYHQRNVPEMRSHLDFERGKLVELISKSPDNPEFRRGLSDVERALAALDRDK